MQYSPGSRDILQTTKMQLLGHIRAADMDNVGDGEHWVLGQEVIGGLSKLDLKMIYSVTFCHTFLMNTFIRTKQHKKENSTEKQQYTA